MINLNIKRTVDELGRIALPIQFRKSLEINEKDKLDVHIEGRSIILTKC
jgi:transcriptional pleiotropic regulator of transition state genes